MHDIQRLSGGRIVVRSPSCRHLPFSLGNLSRRYETCVRGGQLTGTPGCFDL